MHLWQQCGNLGRWIGILILAGLMAQAGDWRQFRGPFFSGQPDPPVRATANGPLAIEWRTPLSGRGASSPILVGDRLFLTGSEGPRQERLWVRAFDAADGRLRWERTFLATGRTTCHAKTCVAAPTPTSDGRRVFVSFSSNDLIAMDLDGDLLWLRGLMLDYPNAGNSLGLSTSLLVVRDTLIVQTETDSEAFAAGIDVRTGVNRWKIDRPKLANWTSPVAVTLDANQAVVVLQSGQGLSGVAPDSGEVLWEYTDGAATIPSTTVQGLRLFTPSHGMTALELQPDGRGYRQLWRSSRLRPGTASPVIAGDRLYAINSAGVLTCAGLADGDRLWQLRLKGSFSATPVFYGSFLYAVSEEGQVHVVDTGAPEGQVTQSMDLGQTLLSTPAIAQGAVFVRSDEMLWKLALR